MIFSQTRPPILPGQREINGSGNIPLVSYASNSTGVCGPILGFISVHDIMAFIVIIINAWPPAAATRLSPEAYSILFSY